MNDLPTGLHNVAALKYRSVGLVKVGGVEHCQGLVDVALQGPVGAVGHCVHQARDEVRGQGNDESLRNTAKSSSVQCGCRTIAGV